MTQAEYNAGHDGMHVPLTCENHSELRWSCKKIATSPDKGGVLRYNGARNIFFASNWDNTGEYVEECSCPPSKLHVVLDPV